MLLRISRTAAVAATILFAGSVSAADLKIGDPAPAVDVAHWFSGVDEGESTAFAKDQVYVVEFWATWCGPCIAAMPHVAELKERYGDDVRIFSISDEKIERVEKFLEGRVRPGYGPKAADNDDKRDKDGEPKDGEPKKQKKRKTYGELTSVYSLGTDPDQSTYEAYMTAAGENGIPTAFIVGKSGLIEWIGHPMTIDEPLAKVVAGDWDREAFVEERRAQQLVIGAFREYRSGRITSKQAIAKLREAKEQIDDPQMVAQADQLIASIEADGPVSDAMAGDAKAQAKVLESIGDDPQTTIRTVSSILQSRGEPDRAFIGKVVEKIELAEFPEEMGPVSAAMRLQLLQSVGRYGDAVAVLDTLIDDPKLAGNAAAFKQMRETLAKQAEQEKAGNSRFRQMRQAITEEAERRKAEQADDAKKATEEAAQD